MKSSSAITQIIIFLALVGCAPLVAQIGSGGSEPFWDVRSIGAVPSDGGNAVSMSFEGLPWADYEILASGDNSSWAPVGQAAANAPGSYRFYHFSVASQQFYRPQIVPPGAPRTLDAYFYSGLAKIEAAITEVGLADNFESRLGIEDEVVDLGQEIEQNMSALQGEITVADLGGGNFRVAWGGDEQTAIGTAERDQAMQGFQQAKMAAGQRVALAEARLDEVANLAFRMDATPPLALAMIAQAGQEIGAIGQLAFPQGAQFQCSGDLIDWFDIEGLQLEKKALQKKKSALGRTVNKLREEAARKRRVAAMPITVFGINGTWIVRWSNVERKYGSEAEARGQGVALMEVLMRARLREAEALDAKIAQLEEQLAAVCTELASVCAELATLEALFPDEFPGCDDNPIEDPEDEDDPRAKFRSWIEFDNDYLDGMWLDMFYERQASKNRLRQQLIRMGASQETLDKIKRRCDEEESLRRKWMSVFCEEPIKLNLLVVNQFTDFEFDIANACWEVSFTDFNTNKYVDVKVGTGGMLCIPPERVKEIFDEATVRQHGSGYTRLIQINVTFDKVHADGYREKCQQSQQVLVSNITRTRYTEIGGR